jgi:hypothetical protein
MPGWEPLELVMLMPSMMEARRPAG